MVSHVFREFTFGNTLESGTVVTVESIQISDMESFMGFPVQLATHGWKPLYLWQMCFQL